MNTTINTQAKPQANSTHADNSKAVLNNVVNQCALLKAALESMMQTCEGESLTPQQVIQQYNQLCAAHRFVDVMAADAVAGIDRV